MRPKSSRPAPWQVRLLKLNRRQTNVLLGGILIVLAMGLFPPWGHVFTNEIGAQSRRPAGFHALGSPPEVFHDPNWSGAHLDWPVLLIEWAVAAAGTALLVYRLRDRNPLTQKLLRRYEIK